MAAEKPETKSLLRELLLSGDESDSCESSQRKRRREEENEINLESKKSFYGFGYIQNSQDTPINGEPIQAIPYKNMPACNLQVQFSPISLQLLNNENRPKPPRPYLFLNSPPPTYRGFWFARAPKNPNEIIPQINYDDLPETSDMLYHAIEQRGLRRVHDVIGLPD